MDHPGQHGHRLQPQVRIRRRSEVEPARVYIVAADLLNVTAEKCGWGEPRSRRALSRARAWKHAVFRHPFLERDSLGILADHVTLEQGTGAVHTAPGHGQEDYVVGRQYGIETYCPVDAAGRFFHAEGAAGRLPEELIGKTVWEANPIVIEILKAHGALLAIEKLAHSYPHCWRCHNPTIFRATEQWFIGMERNDFRQRALEAIHQHALDARVGRGAHLQHDRHAPRLVHLAPARVGRAHHRLLLRPVPRAAHRPQDPGRHRGAVPRAHRRRLVRAHRRRTAARRAPSAPSAAAPSSARRTTFWTCGSIPAPATWPCSTSASASPGPPTCTSKAATSIAAGSTARCWWAWASRAARPTAPARSNGWVLDGEGRAMHKSLGNAIEPEEIIKHHGAEILRLWSASVDFNEDVRLSRDHPDAPGGRLPQAAQHLPLPARQPARISTRRATPCRPPRCRRSTSGFCCAPKTWWPAAAPGTTNFEFHKVYHSVYAFATVDLSAIYFDVLKDRLYTSAAKSQARRSAQTALYRLLDALVRLLAPHELHRRRSLEPHGPRRTASTWRYFPEPARTDRGPRRCRPETRRATGTVSWKCGTTCSRAWKTARNEKLIGAPLEARVRLSADGDLYPLLEQYARELPGLFIVSQVELERAAATP